MNTPNNTRPRLISVTEASLRSGLTPKMIRYYERLGLFPPPARDENDYRAYTQDELDVLYFIKRGRDLGFAPGEMGDLLKLWQTPERSNADIKRSAQEHYEQINQRLAAMQSIQRTLARLIESCDGEQRLTCPVIDDVPPYVPPPPAVDSDEDDDE